MSTGALCGVAPFFFRKKFSGFERNARAETNNKTFNSSSKNTKNMKGPTHVRSSCGVAENFVTMTELRNKITTLRDLLDFCPCAGSATVNELLMLTLNDLFKRYPKIKPFEIKDVPMHKALKLFCDALKSVGDLWTTEKWMVKCKYNKAMKLQHVDLEQIALGLLEDVIKLARERLFEEMDEDDDMRDYSRPSNAFGKALSESYSDGPMSLSTSPLTPTSVLPNAWNSSNIREKGSYSLPMLMPLGVQAVGKLNPIDLKRLSFHMFSHAIVPTQDNRHTNKNETTGLVERCDEDLRNVFGQVKPVEQDCKDIQDDEVMRDMEVGNEVAGYVIGMRDETGIIQTLTSTIQECTSNNNKLVDLVTPLLPPPQTLPAANLWPELSPLPPAADLSVQSPSLPNTNLPTLFSPLPPPPPPLPRTSAVSFSPPPPPAMQQNVAAPPPPLPPSITLPNAAPPPPMAARNSGPLPSAPPPLMGASKGPPPPPPPMGGGKVSGPLQPPMTGNNGGPPPPLGSASLRPRKAVTKLKRSSQMGNLYRLLKGKVEGSSLDGKSSGRKGKIGAAATGGKQGMADALAEMTKRSAYFQQIEEDVKNYACVIQEVKIKIISFETSDIAELLKFHKYVESHLEKLTDETQVLARFDDFPGKKLEAIRMAAALYSKLSSIVSTLQNWPVASPVGQLLDKAESYFNKIKVEMDALERTKDEELKRFKAQKINFDFGILIRIKELMVDVSSNCMELALKDERETVAKENRDLYKPETKTKILWRAFQFAFRVYTFAGGHDDRADKLTRELAKEIETEH